MSPFDQSDFSIRLLFAKRTSAEYRAVLCSLPRSRKSLAITTRSVPAEFLRKWLIPVQADGSVDRIGASQAHVVDIAGARLALAERDELSTVFIDDALAGCVDSDAIEGHLRWMALLARTTGACVIGVVDALWTDERALAVQLWLVEAAVAGKAVRYRRINSGSPAVIAASLDPDAVLEGWCPGSRGQA